VHIEIPISVGELVDRITILRLKKDKLDEREKVANVGLELAHLEEILEREVGDLKGIESLVVQLHDVNAHLWEIEDELRDLESVQNFGVRFIEIARRVYQFNDERYRLKRAISDHYGSMFVEEKSYS
jgi:hypothetical protein|tara:strand:+ start:707 stop:1087 length:381 start_codon:yes stop_codon:yes gene_type:complete